MRHSCCTCAQVAPVQQSINVNQGNQSFVKTKQRRTIESRRPSPTAKVFEQRSSDANSRSDQGIRTSRTRIQGPRTRSHNSGLPDDAAQVANSSRISILQLHCSLAGMCSCRFFVATRRIEAPRPCAALGGRASGQAGKWASGQVGKWASVTADFPCAPARRLNSRIRRWGGFDSSANCLWTRLYPWSSIPDLIGQKKTTIHKANGMKWTRDSHGYLFGDMPSRRGSSRDRGLTRGRHSQPKHFDI